MISEVLHSFDTTGFTLIFIQKSTKFFSGGKNIAEHSNWFCHLAAQS